MDNNKRDAIIITLVISTAFTLTACGKPSSNSSFSDSNSSFSASADINSSIEDNSSLSEQTTVTTSTPSTTQSNIKQPSVNPQTTSPKAPTKSQVATAKVQAGITPPPTTTQVTKKLIVPTAAQCQVIENEIIRLVNQYRASKGLHSLTVESKLIQGARIRAEEVSHINCFGHKRPNGDLWSTVLTDVQYGEPYTDYYYGPNGEILSRQAYSAGPGAENLASRSTLSINQQFYFNCTDVELKNIAKSMFEGWKASADHNKSMVSTIYTKIGVGVYAKYETTLQNDKDIGFYGIQTFTQK